MEVSRLEQPEQGAEEGGGASEKKNIEKQKEMDHLIGKIIEKRITWQ